MKDLHTHILPRMDDGARSSAESLALLALEREQGVTGIALTPHFYCERESEERFLARREAAWRQLHERMAEQAETYPTLVLGAEVAWRPNLERREALAQLCLGKSRYLLLELPEEPWSGAVIDGLYGLLGRVGITPVLAHVERCIAGQRREHIEELYRMGVPMQWSAEAYLHPLRRGALRRMAARNAVNLLASDCHDTERRTPKLARGAEVVRAKAGAWEAMDAAAKRIFRAALEGEER